MPAMTTGDANPIGVLAHAGGWDEILLILAPLAGLLWVLPQTQGWGRLWGRLFIGTVFAQAVQVLTLRLGFSLATGLPSTTASGLLEPLPASRCSRWS